MGLTEADGQVTRVELDNDQWWDIRTRLTWGDTKALRSLVPGDNPDALKESDSPVLEGAADKYLVRFTEGWSFPEEVSLEALDKRALDDVIKVLRVVNTKVIPFLTARLTAS